MRELEVDVYERIMRLPAAVRWEVRREQVVDHSRYEEEAKAAARLGLPAPIVSDAPPEVSTRYLIALEVPIEPGGPLYGRSQTFTGHGATLVEAWQQIRAAHAALGDVLAS